MAHGEERYTGPLVRWLRPQAQPPEVYAGAGDLDTREFRSLYQQKSLKVHVECSHLKSEWGLIEGVDAWTPYLQLSFKQPKSPRWAKLTVEVKPRPVRADVRTGAGPGAPPAAGVSAGGAVVDNSRPCLTPYIYPIELWGVVRRTDSNTTGGTLSPTVGAGGVTVAVGSLNFTTTRNYANSVEDVWKIDGEPNTCDGSSYFRQAIWQLQATRSKTIPKQLRVGLIVKHERTAPFDVSVKIEGAIYDGWLGEYYFSGQTGVFTVQMDPSQLIGPLVDFTNWATKMKDHMVELGYNPVPEVQFIEMPLVR